MTRQLKLYYQLINSRIIGPTDIMSGFGITRRMLQRDLKDLRDCGLINVKYDRKQDQYLQVDNTEFDNSASVRRKQHLIRLHRIGALILKLSKTDPEELHTYETALEEYDFALQESLGDPVANPPEYIPDKPESLDLPDIKSEYYALFPNSNERTRQRDFEEMNRAGFNIYYSRKYKSFIYEYQYNL